MLLFKKLARDFWSARGRTAAMILAISVGLIALSTLISSRDILLREANRNYRETRPATVIFELDEVAEHTLAWARKHPQVEAAVRRTKLMGQIHADGLDEGVRTFVFVVDDFEDQDIARIAFEDGTWPPPPGTIAIERSSLSMLDGKWDRVLRLALPSGRVTPWKVSAVVHEPALAPADTEQAIYAYVRAEDLKKQAVDLRFDELRLKTRGPEDLGTLESEARKIASDLEASQKIRVESIRVPPPGQHPHQTQMSTVLGMFVIFALLLFVLCGLLTSSLLATMMNRQVREIGVMKTLGARSKNIRLAYFSAIAFIALSAVLLSLIPSYFATQAMVGAITGLLNFDTVSTAPEVSTIAMGLLLSLSLPLILAAPTIARGSSVTVSKALLDFGQSVSKGGPGKIETWLRGLSWDNRMLVHAVRNVFRRRKRFTLSVSLLTTAGAIFLAAIGTANAWTDLTADLYESRHYDFEVQLSRNVSDARLRQATADLPEIAAVESWRSTATAPAAGRERSIQRTYPDGAHGDFRLMALPEQTNLITLSPAEGRLPRPDEEDAVAINQLVPGAKNYRIGDSIALDVHGSPAVFTVVGKLSEVGVGATAYINTATFSRHVKQEDTLQTLLVRKSPTSSTEQAMPALGHRLGEHQILVQQLIPLSIFENSVAAHFDVLIRSLLILAVMTALVGGIGLMAALSSHVTEGAREIGMLRALGANAKQIRAQVLSESLVISLSAFAFSVPLGLLLSGVLGQVIGEMSFGMRLPLAPRHVVFIGLLLCMLALGVISGLGPAGRASRKSVATTLRTL